MQRTARYGDGWLAIFCSARRFAQTKEQIAEAAAALVLLCRLVGINVWCGLDADVVRRRLLASQLESLYHLPFGKFEHLTPAGSSAQVTEAWPATVRRVGVHRVVRGCLAEAGVEHAAAVRAMLNRSHQDLADELVLALAEIGFGYGRPSARPGQPPAVPKHSIVR